MNIESDTETIFEERRQAIDNYMLSNLNVPNPKLEDATKYLIKQGGKRLRPVLLCLTSEMLGESYTNALPLASAIEAIHTSSLIQDDLPAMDDDKLRRGGQSVHTKFNESTAILASNILRSRATAWCHQISRDVTVMREIVEEIDRISTSISAGQKLDLAYESRQTISEDEYIDMISKKTARIYGSSASISGIFTGVEDEDMKSLDSFGENLGIAFQITDDILDIISDEIGKDRKSDLKREKKTAITIHTMNQGYDLFESSNSVDDMCRMIEEAGSVEWAQQQAELYSQRAIADLNSLDVKNEDMRGHISNIIKSTRERDK